MHQGFIISIASKARFCHAKPACAEGFGGEEGTSVLPIVHSQWQTDLVLSTLPSQ